MKKRYVTAVVSLVSLIAAIAAPVQAVAEDNVVVNSMTDRTGRSDLGLQLAGGFSSDQIDDALYVGGVYSYGVNPWLALGVEAGWQEADFDITNDDDLNMLTAFGEVIGRASIPDWAGVPYGVIGIGVLHAYTDVVSDNDDETAFAMKFGAGLDWFLTPKWILNVEAAYIATGGEINSGIANTEDLDHWRVGGGLKFVF